jgi:hypothetical protein
VIRQTGVRRLPLLDDVTPSNASRFPPLHARWLDAIFGAPVPLEPRATCDDCAMLRPNDEHAQDDDTRAYFDATTKCCTYFPKLSSFLVGAILADGDAAMLEGRSRIEARIAARVAVTPLGVGPPSHYDALYDPAVRFGRSPALRCPYHLDDGGCGVWRHRNGVCMTWFCKHARGEIGRELWMRIEQLFTAAERQLARWCAIELDVGDDALGALLPHPQRAANDKLADAGDLDGRVDEERYRAQWGSWIGRERELFLSCAEIVAPLAWEDIVGIGGAEVAALVRVATRAFAQAASHGVPSRLEVRPHQVVSVDATTTRIVTYSPHDPLDVPNAIVDVLPALARAPLADARLRVQRARGVDVDDEILARLVDFGVLRAAP